MSERKRNCAQPWASERSLWSGRPGLRRHRLRPPPRLRPCWRSTARKISSPRPPTRPQTGGLTPREREVLRLVVAGRSNPEIAAALFLSRRTVTTHLTRIFAKLGVAGRAEAAVLAVRRGLV